MISRRYNYTFSLIRPIFRLYNRLANRSRPVPDPGLAPDQPALILANHVTSLDPFYLSTGIARPVFYVASDHIFRLGLASRIISFLVAPIPIVKSRIDLRTIRTIRTIKSIIDQAGLVGLFPEGNRSFNGLTGRILPATGKLVRQLRSPLLLYKIHGGYLSSPRWGRHRRRGVIRCELAMMLTADELAAMSPDAINELIQSGIDVDAFADQKSSPVRFKGRRLAEYLERALFICPKCEGLSTLSSKENLFFCSCGLTVRYNHFGLFDPADDWSKTRQSDGLFFDNTGSWDLWQRQKLIEMLDRPEIVDPDGITPVFRDSEEVLFNCERASQSILLDRGEIALYVDRLEFSGIRSGRQLWPLENLDRLIVHGPQVLQFATSDGGVFESRSRRPRSAYKYVILTKLLQQRQKGEKYGFFGF